MNATSRPLNVADASRLLVSPAFRYLPMKSLATVLVVALLVVGGALFWLKPSSSAVGPSFRTAQVERDELVVIINATGTIEPEEVVDVGAQVAGRIVEFGKDAQTDKTIDYGSLVEPGTVLARIDDAVYREDVELARADLAQSQSLLSQAKTAVLQAKADVLRAEADLKAQQSKLRQYDRDLKRNEDLRRKNAVSDQEYDLSVAMVEQSQALVEVAQAVIQQSHAALESAETSIAEKTAAVARGEAILRKGETNLGYTTITSPIAGVIIDRRVNIGQTVVASLNAPSLFLIAKDLKRIQVWASVNEADIGRIRQGQTVRFTVDTYPGETFTGRVEQIRLNASMTQNVVTYTVIVSADNTDGRLLPYLTANLQFEVARRPGARLVPSAALRWKPRPEQIAAEHREEKLPAFGTPDAAGEGVLWVAQGAYVRPMIVRTGLADSGRTEILSDDLPDGTAVILGEQVRGGGPSEVNPLAPKAYGGNRS